VPHLKTYVLLVLAMFFWGGTFVVGRIMGELVNPEMSSFLRFLVSSLLLFPILIYYEGSLPRLNLKQFIAVIVLGLSGVFVYNLLFFSGLQHISAGRASLIIAINPVLIAAISWVFLSEHVNAKKIVGMLLSLAGVLLVISQGDIMALLQGQLGTGELMILGCVISWVLYTLVGKGVMKGISPLAAVTYSCAAGTVLLYVFAIPSGLSLNDYPQQLSVWLGVLYFAVFATVLGFLWFYQAVNTLGAATTGLFINLVPLSGVSFGIIFLNEKLSLSLLLGAVLILAGIWLNSRPVKQSIKS